MGYVAHYGYADGSGDYYISIDTGKCDGCQKCVGACAHGVFEMILDDYEESVPVVAEAHRKKLRFSCAGCKPVDRSSRLPCVDSCVPGALRHSW